MKRFTLLLLTLLLLVTPAMGAATATLIPQPKFTAMDSNGDPYVGGKLYTYETGTTTPKATWTDSTKVTANANPVILDSRGQADVWVDSSGGAYRFRLLDSDDVTVWTVDGISDLRTASSDTTFLVGHNSDGTHKGYRLLSEFDSLSAAVTSIGTVETELWINQDDTMTGNVTVPDTLVLRFIKGNIITTGGNNLIINSPESIIASPTMTIFSGGSTVSFIVGGKVWVDWWGENTTPGTTDMTTPVTDAITSQLNIGGEVWCNASTYIIGDVNISGTGTTTPGTSFPAIIGYGDNSQWAAIRTTGGTIFKAKAGAAYILKLGDGTNYLQRAKFKNIVFDGNSKASDGIWNRSAVLTKLEKVVFYQCKGAFIMQKSDRLKMSEVGFYESTYGIYYDSAIHTGNATNSDVSLADCNHRSNDYNMYLSATTVSNQLVITRGYWSSANIGDVYVTGAAKSLIFDGVNFENTPNGSSSTKSAVFQMGMVHVVGHVGIPYVGIKNCLFQDNNAIADRPVIMSIVDSTDTSNPSISVLNIEGNLFYSSSGTPPIAKAAALTTGISLFSEVGSAFWENNFATIPPVINSIWRSTATASGTGIGSSEIKNTRIVSPQMLVRLLNRTTSLTVQAAESGGVYTSTNVGGTIIFTLPAISSLVSDNGFPMWYFVNIGGTTMRIDPQDDEGFVDGSGLGKYKNMSNTVGTACLVMGVSTTKATAWQAIPLNGAILTNE